MSYVHILTYDVNILSSSHHLEPSLKEVSQSPEGQDLGSLMAPQLSAGTLPVRKFAKGSACTSTSSWISVAM